MVKKCIVQFDELGKPINIIDIKEFNDVESFKNFKKLCEENHKSFVQRRAKEEAEFQKKKAEAIKELEYLKKGVIAAMKGISYLLGYDDYTPEEIIAVFKELMPEGEKHDEEEH